MKNANSDDGLLSYVLCFLRKCISLHSFLCFLILWLLNKCFLQSLVLFRLTYYVNLNMSMFTNVQIKISSNWWFSVSYTPKLSKIGSWKIFKFNNISEVIVWWGAIKITFNSKRDQNLSYSTMLPAFTLISLLLFTSIISLLTNVFLFCGWL